VFRDGVMDVTKNDCSEWTDRTACPEDREMWRRSQESKERESEGGRARLPARSLFRVYPYQANVGKIQPQGLQPRFGLPQFLHAPPETRELV
jgi:hypothetical protein